MEYLVIAYALIALVLIGYTLYLHRRMAKVERERALLEERGRFRIG